MSRQTVLLCLLALLGACGAAEQATDAGADRPEPLVVYVPEGSSTYTAERFKGFTARTGVPVVIRQDDAMTNVDHLIHNTGTPRADVLLAPSVQGIWRAADAGALRPLLSDRLQALLPPQLIDPDGTWVAVDLRLATIVYDIRSVNANELGDYGGLGGPGYQGKLCLTSSALPGNRVLIAMLIDVLGVRPAERLIRRWVDNFAQPPFANQAGLLDAIANQACAVGIVALRTGSTPNASGVLRYYTPSPAYGDIDAAGIARHTAQPDVARQFIEWLVADSGITGQQPGDAGTALAERNLGIAGWRDDDATRLAERAAYR